MSINRLERITRNSIGVLSYAFGIEQGIEEARQQGTPAGIGKALLCAFFPSLSHQIKKDKPPIIFEDLPRALWFGITPDLIARGMGFVLILKGEATALGGLAVLLIENLSIGLANKIEQNTGSRNGK